MVVKLSARFSNTKQARQLHPRFLIYLKRNPTNELSNAGESVGALIQTKTHLQPTE